MSYQTIHVSVMGSICKVRINRPDVNNAINSQLIEELGEVLTMCEDDNRLQAITILVLEGLPEVFCSGGDFDAMTASSNGGQAPEPDPEPLYDLWLRMVRASFICISVVRGRVNAGGIGFVAASDIVLADHSASFSLSELLFGLFPACVMPFLSRRTGLQKAHYMTLMTRVFTAQEALDAQLVDALGDQIEVLLRTHLLRLQRLDKTAISRYKAYVAQLCDEPLLDKHAALEANRTMFKDPQNLRNIARYVQEAKFPWEE